MSSTTQISHCEAPPCFPTSRFLFKSLENDCDCEISRKYLSSICSCEVRALIKEKDSLFSSQFISPSSFDLLSIYFDLLSRLCASCLKCLACLWSALLLQSASLTYSANYNVNESISFILWCSWASFAKDLSTSFCTNTWPLFFSPLTLKLELSNLIISSSQWDSHLILSFSIWC